MALGTLDEPGWCRSPVPEAFLDQKLLAARIGGVAQAAADLDRESAPYDVAKNEPPVA